MLDCKMTSSLSPVTPANILSEYYNGMWDIEMNPPPTKLETTDIMDLIDPNMSGSSSTCGSGCGGTETSNGSPTTIIHYTSRDGAYSNSHQSESPSSTSSSQYLTPLPSLSEAYSTAGESQHLEGFHGGMDPSFYHKLHDASHPFQESGYDAFISDLPHQAPVHSNGHSHHHLHHVPQHHHPLHHVEQSSHPGNNFHPHLHPTSHLSQLHHGNNGGGLMNGHHASNGVLLLDMSNHHPNRHHGGQCSPGCLCNGHGGGHGFSAPGSESINGESLVGLCHPAALPSSAGIHHQEYGWDDIQCEPGDYSCVYRKGESPSTSDSVSYTDNDSESKSSGGSLSTIHEISNVTPPKRKVGRPPKKDKKLKRSEKKTGRLWEFIRDLLKNPEYCPSLVKWENHEEGHFRFVNSEKVAQLWGQIKGNPRMTYEKLSRAMRYYYKSHVFEPVLGRRLVYKFGYNATNWKPVNPNFVTSQKLYS